MKPKIKINFKDFWFPDTEERKKNFYLYKLLSKKYDLELTDNPDFLIYSYFGGKHYKYDCVKIYYTGENSRPNFNECDYSFSFDYPNDDKNFRLPLFRINETFATLFNNERDKDALNLGNRKFCNFLYKNWRPQERVKFFNMLQEYKKVDSGGPFLNNIGYKVGNTRKDKFDFLSQYKFTIAFENSSYPGYTTEKITDAFFAGTIPIYWGNPIVSKDFNPKAFINCHDYNSFEEVIEHVIEVDNNDELYNAYIKEPVFSENEENLYLDEDNILGRFDEIFKNKDINRVARKTDIIKYYLYIAHRKKLYVKWALLPYYRKVRQLISKLV